MKRTPNNLSNSNLELNKIVCDEETKKRYSFDFETRLTSISKQSSIILFEKIGFQFITFLSSILLARILGISLLGRYQLGIVVVQLLSVIAIMGFDRGFMKFIPVYNLNAPGKTKKVLLDSILVSFAVSVTLSIFMYIYAPLVAMNFFHSIEMARVLRIFSFYLPIFTLFALGSASFNGFKRADITSHITNFFNPVIFVIFLSILLLTDVNIISVISARIISVIISSGFIIYFMAKKFSYVFRIKSVSYDLRNYLSYSFPLLAIAFLYFFIGRVDILMLGYFLESGQVGIYSVIVNIATLCIFGLQAVNAIFAPNISELYTLGDIDNLESLLKTITKWIFYLSFFLFTFIAIFRIELLNMFGPSFTIGGKALIILAFGQLINSFTGPTGTVLLMAGRQNWEVFNSAAIIIINILLNYFLIPMFGIEGAAMSTAIAVSVINLLKLLETYKEFRIHPYNTHFLKGTFAIVAGTVPLYALKWFFNSIGLHFVFILFISMIINIIIFIALIHFLKYDEEDKLILNKIATKFNLKSKMWRAKH